MKNMKQRPKKYELNDVPQIVTEKGVTVEWCKGVEGKQITIYHRKKGSSFADHYHTGSDSSKKPERFYLIAGEVLFNLFDKYSNTKEHITVTAGQELLIYPYLYHKATAFSDAIFIEYKSEEFDPDNSDIHSFEEYQLLD